MKLEKFELLYAYLDQNSLRWTKPDESVYNSIRCVEKELNRTKRALWLARAERAKVFVLIDMYDNYIASQEDKGKTPKAELGRWFAGWNYAEHVCRQYADKFREE